MRNMKSVYLIGLGAIGASFCSKFIENDYENFKVIANGKRKEKYESSKFIVNNKEYKFKFISSEDNMEKADLIIIACKFHHLSDVIKQVKPFVNSKTVIMSLLNGISSEAIIAKELGEEKLLYSVCYGIDALRNDNGISYKNLGTIMFGEKENSVYSNRVEGIKNLFDEVGIPYDSPKDLMKVIWRKFMINVGINQTSAILRADYKVFQNDYYARKLMDDTMREVIGLANKLGIDLGDEDIELFHDFIDTFAPNGKTSMLQDIESKRKTEVEMFAGEMIKLGGLNSYDTPINNILFDMIKTIENNY
ncbi:ketopantoate reductase family protein [Helicovermis profundi]|uniref:2-dehydropantoate 2-reductase n=1 Tax=Helicovermis profundi TaxID=3065157 RepID=A0AAU9EB76_9FIRM|nr:2-dehydropantoate 2-reductase [Clostridia bacterium S502]